MQESSSFCIIPLLVQSDFQAVDLLDPQGCLVPKKKKNHISPMQLWQGPFGFSKN